nr:autotransporter domain-containing protein [Mesorhizobium sp. M1E.F.Ca.ET.045.02.1.1]
MAFAEDGPELAPATTDRFAAWSTAIGSWGRGEADGIATLKRSAGGVVVGVDGSAFEAWRVGAIAGYSHTNFDVKDRASSGDSENYTLGFLWRHAMEPVQPARRRDLRMAQYRDGPHGGFSRLR